MNKLVKARTTSWGTHFAIRSSSAVLFLRCAFVQRQKASHLMCIMYGNAALVFAETMPGLVQKAIVNENFNKLHSGVPSLRCF